MLPSLRKNACVAESHQRASMDEKLLGGSRKPEAKPEKNRSQSIQPTTSSGFKVVGFAQRTVNSWTVLLKVVIIITGKIFLDFVNSWKFYYVWNFVLKIFRYKKKISFASTHFCNSLCLRLILYTYSKKQ